jgi:hypothetical protein
MLPKEHLQGSSTNSHMHNFFKHLKTFYEDDILPFLLRFPYILCIHVKDWQPL